MPPPRHNILGRSAAVATVLLALALLSIGCGSDERDDPPVAPPLLHGRPAEVLAAHLAPAARLAIRFADSYARNAYRQRPPRLPGATAALTRHLAQAATRVPPSRRDLRPRAIEITLTPRSSTTLHGSVEIGDRHSPPFSVGFTLEKRDSDWRVVFASPPS
jgi:hypothetical protein